jgi:lysophospholipase L1-like esterase
VGLRTTGLAAWRLLVTGVSLALLSGLLLIAGINFDWLVLPDRPASLRAALLQLGSLGLMVSAATMSLLWLRAEQRRAVLAQVRTVVTAVTISLLAMFAAGELAIRWIYRDGMSFSSHYGPLVRRFERNFHFNRFDGPSRGPEAVGPKAPGERRVLFQGDSITWGQGVKDETLLYTGHLLARLRAVNPAVTAATLATPGREIDGHLAQLLHWGDEIAPDLIIYQWYINDIELDKSARPGPRKRLWRQLFFHGTLMRYSYLWFFLDYVLDVKLPSSAPSYEDYITAQYAMDSDRWAQFSQAFHAWSVAARRLTPRVIVVLVPHIRDRIELAEFHDRMIELCRQEEVVPLDLIPWFDVFKDDYSQTFATPFDRHPNAVAHERIAQALYHTIEITCPELLLGPNDQPGPKSAYLH